MGPSECLNQFEYKLLDEDGGTKGMAQFMEQGIDIFRIGGEEARRKYSFLIPQGFKPNPLKTFERMWLDIMGSTERQETALRDGLDVFKYRPEGVVGRKYGHLIRIMPRLPEGVVEEKEEDEQLGPDELTDSSMEERKRRILSGVEKARTDKQGDFCSVIAVLGMEQTNSSKFARLCCLVQDKRASEEVVDIPRSLLIIITTTTFLKLPRPSANLLLINNLKILLRLLHSPLTRRLTRQT